MQADVPAIYHRQVRVDRVSPQGRLLAGLIALGCLSVLIVAARLIPDPAGLGTHREMGLDECGWLRITGLPCPACGMTTSFAWFVRGNIVASLYVQPMGTVLAALCGMTVWAAGYLAVTGRPVHRLLSSLSTRYHVLPLLAMTLIAWGWKIFIHLHGIDGWK